MVHCVDKNQLLLTNPCNVLHDSKWQNLTRNSWDSERERFLQRHLQLLLRSVHNLSGTASPLWSTSWSGALHFILHKFFSPNQCLLFATHSHTIATCFTVVPKLYHLFLVSLSTLYLELYLFTLTSHIHLTILISARWSATSFSFLTGQVLLPCSTLLRTQLLYSLPLLINDISLLVTW